MCRVAVAAVQQAYPKRKILLYTCDDLTAAQLTQNAALKFGVTLKGSLEVCLEQGVYLWTEGNLEHQLNDYLSCNILPRKNRYTYSAGVA